MEENNLIKTPPLNIDKDLRNDFERIKYSILILMSKSARLGHTFIFFQDIARAKKMADHFLLPKFWENLETIQWAKLKEDDPERKVLVREMRALRFSDGFVVVIGVNTFWKEIAERILPSCRKSGITINHLTWLKEEVRIKFVLASKTLDPGQLNELLVRYESEALGTNLWPHLGSPHLCRSKSIIVSF